MLANQNARAGLDVREIVAIDAVARSRSFKIASELVNTTQPTLSRLVQSAETALGTSLFRRGWFGAETTPAGDVTARMCRSALDAINRTERELFSDRKGIPPFWLNLRSTHLRTIEAVTREGSVTFAAKRLGRSQPDLSRTISDFTKRFDTELFRRTPSGMEALPSAQSLTELCGTIDYLLDRLLDQLSQLDGALVGRVSIGMLPFSGQHLVSRCFARLSNMHPNVRLVCGTGSYNGLLEALRRREIDRIIGIQRGAACPDGLIETHLFDERFAVIARRDHELQSEQQTLSDLARQNWIVAPHGTPVRMHFEAVFSAKGLTPPTQTCEMLSFAAAEQLLVESQSIALLTYSEQMLERLRPELKEVPSDFPRGVAPIGITRLKDADDGPALKEFERILLELTHEYV